MILSPSRSDKYDKAKTLKDKAKVVFGKEIGEPIGIAYQKYTDKVNIPKYLFKEPMLFKFSYCKEFYDKFLCNCDAYLEKCVEDKAKVFLDFLLQNTPSEWVQNECNYNNSKSIEDEEVTIDNKSYNINDIDILAQNPTIQSIHKKYTYEEINLNPDFQRNKIWTLKQKSLLIESILINIPIPAFYIDARLAGKMNVIDGLQRLSTIMDFIDDEFSLVDTEYLKLRGKRFTTLDRKYQRRIEDYELTFNMVRSSTPPEVAFNIFSRINTLGTPLSAQEIRHAMNMGIATDFLKELSNTDEFKIAISEQNHRSLSKRMNDKALILRYLSFKILGYEDSSYEKNDMNAFLIEAMVFLNNLNPKDKLEDFEYLNKLKNDFRDSMIKANTVFKEKCFRKYFSLNDENKAPISIPLFETITNTLTKYSLEEVEKYKKEIVTKFLELFTEKETEDNYEEGRFIDWITKATNNPDHVRKRFKKVNQVFTEIIG